MNRVLYLVMLLLICQLYSAAGDVCPPDVTGMPVPSFMDMPGSSIDRSEVYEGGALWGLINGAADLYYEYGFDRMALQEISWHGEVFRLELYRMTSLPGAFGIFSVSVHGCINGGPATTADCQNNYQYQLYSGRYYLSLINGSGSDKARELSVEIGKVVLSAIGKDYIELPGLFRQEMFAGKTDQIRLIKGMIGLQNAIPHSAPFFMGIDGFVVWLLMYGENDHRAEILLAETGSSDTGEELVNLTADLENAGYILNTGPKRIIAVRDRQGVRQSSELMNIMISGLNENAN